MRLECDRIGNDVLAFASTSRTASDAETKVISTINSGTSVTLTGGMTNAHSGTSPTQAEVINLTRNIKIRGASASLQGYVTVTSGSAVCNVSYAELYNLGSALSSFPGILIGCGVGGSTLFEYCSVHDFTIGGGT